MQTIEGADAVLAGITEISGRSVKIEKKLRDPTDKKGNKSKSNEVDMCATFTFTILPFI